MKTLSFQFGNPTISGGALLLDLQASSSESLKIFGINLRFFYDTRIFKPALTTNSNFKIILPSGYRQYNPFNANSPTGWGLFGSTGAITYINTAVELTAPSMAVEVNNNGWTKVLQLKFTPKVPLTGEQCPSFILDKNTYQKPEDEGKEPGGFMNSSGLVCTEYIGSKGGEMLTGPTSIAWLHMNWSQNPAATRYPWGMQTKNDCFTI